MRPDEVTPVKPQDSFKIPVQLIPKGRVAVAITAGVADKLIFKTWGGLGDQICAEPTLRYALSIFKKEKIYLAAERPELFTHLKFERVFDVNEEVPVWSKYLVFETITPPNDSNLVWQFISHMVSNCVDFSSICALRCQLPVKDREVRLEPKLSSEQRESLSKHLPQNAVLVHAGQHWASKTFPKEWWDRVLVELINRSALPVLIGAETDDNRTTVNVNTQGCLDLRGKTSIPESIWLCQNARVLLTNDSAPLHMAASGNAWIGFIATCKHPDYITHWRNGQWGWRMQNHGKGGLWDITDYSINDAKEVSMEYASPEQLLSWLPEPKDYAEWAVAKLG